VIFDELLTFTNKRITDSTLKVQVYDKDEGKSHDQVGFLWDDILGECDVNLNLLNLREDAESEVTSLRNAQWFECSIKLMHCIKSLFQCALDDIQAHNNNGCRV
jgi:hypothetical protein